MYVTVSLTTNICMRLCSSKVVYVRVCTQRNTCTPNKNPSNLREKGLEDSGRITKIKRMLNNGQRHKNIQEKCKPQAPLMTQKGRIPSGVTNSVMENNVLWLWVRATTERYPKRPLSDSNQDSQLRITTLQ
jgi:hypothetical protein